MSTRSKLTATAALLLAIGGLGLIDGYMNRREITAYLPTITVDPPSPTPSDAASQTSTPSSAVGVAKEAGPDVSAIAEAMKLTTKNGNELSLVEQIVMGKTPVTSMILLKDGDRAGSVTWVDSPFVKTYFTALKESLLPAFSPQVRDLKDTTQQEPGLPIRNVLTFLDPGLSEERLAFVRVRERLYEFHIAAKQEAAMTVFINAVTSK